jgi:ADP-heptose:LPS heptosyltransferase
LSWYDIPADRADLSLRRPASAGLPSGVTVLHPGSKIPAKRWPAERFAALARALTDQGHRVLLTGSADERALVARVAEAAGLSPDAVLAGRTDLGALAALVGCHRRTGGLHRTGHGTGCSGPARRIGPGGTG